MDARWRLDLPDGSGGSGGKAPKNPPGFASLREIGGEEAGSSKGARGGSSGAAVDRHAAANTPAERVKRAYEFAAGQLQSVGMQVFMMYMSGNGVHMMSMMITFNCIYAPAKAILSSGKTFERFDASGAADMTGPRLMFCALQCVCLAMALYKLNTMGLLPTHASDWVSGLKPPVPAERAYGGTAL
jgi:hypothetical protein